MVNEGSPNTLWPTYSTIYKGSLEGDIF